MKKRELIIAPSILAGDFGRLAEEAKSIEASGADCIHVDIMDGLFVPNISMGPQALAAINRATDLFLDVHVMTYNPFALVERLVGSGADRITFHFEATEDIEATLEYIRKCNIQAGLAFCPETSVEFVPRYLTQCDLILLMTVHPGFGGQEFMPEVLEKIEFTRSYIDQQGIRAGGAISTAQEKKKSTSLTPFLIEVDGGIDQQTASQCVAAGANVLVAGTYLFSQTDMSVGISTLRGAGE